MVSHEQRMFQNLLQNAQNDQIGGGIVSQESGKQFVDRRTQEISGGSNDPLEKARAEAQASQELARVDLQKFLVYMYDKAKNLPDIPEFPSAIPYQPDNASSSRDLTHIPQNDSLSTMNLRCLLDSNNLLQQNLFTEQPYQPASQ